MVPIEPIYNCKTSFCPDTSRTSEVAWGLEGFRGVGVRVPQTQGFRAYSSGLGFTVKGLVVKVWDSSSRGIDLKPY